MKIISTIAVISSMLVSSVAFAADTNTDSGFTTADAVAAKHGYSMYAKEKIFNALNHDADFKTYRIQFFGKFFMECGYVDTNKDTDHRRYIVLIDRTTGNVGSKVDSATTSKDENFENIWANCKPKDDA